MRKRAKIFYYDEMVNYASGTEFICVAGADLAGRIAKVAEDGFMQLVWKDSNESIENEIAYKFFPFVNLQL